MALRFYNTLTKKKEVFKPLKRGVVTIYNCGPTVYDYAHIGNFRAYIFADILRRYLKWRGFRIKQVMNITDVDDKTIRDSQKQGMSLKSFTEKYTKAFFEDLKALNIERVEIYPKATGHIKEMVGLLRTLLKKGYAYKSSDGIYYDISKFRDYGKFAGIELKGLKAGARVKQDEYEKENAQDFALWKFWTKSDGNVFWEEQFGEDKMRGRPGWHIECSAMSMKYLGETFDIHTGGVDLIFPHHQNEIAQSEGATDKRFVNYWLHNGYLLVNGEKMSKSLGNFFTLRDLLKKGHDPRAIRYLLLSAHYRTKLNFTEEGLRASENTVKSLDNFLSVLESVKGGKENKKIRELSRKTREGFEKAMDDDLNISRALAVLFDMVKEVNRAISGNNISDGDAREVYNTVISIDRILGLKLGKQKKTKIPPEIKKLADLREKYRKEKNWKKADKIRSDLQKRGYVLEDTEKGTKIKKLK